MTAEAAGAVPDDVIDNVYDALAVKVRDACCADRRKACPECARYLDGVEAALTVPSVAEVFARDAKVREIVEADPPTEEPIWFHGLAPDDSYDRIAALYSEVGTR